MEQGFHGRWLSSFEVVNCDFLYIAITINDQIFLIPLQHWEGTSIRTLERVTMSTMANVDKTGVPKGHRECVLVECHGTVEEEVEQSALNFEVRGGNLSAGRMSLGR